MEINYLKNYYEILGVPKNSSAEEIKIAHRKKALEFHPDKAKDKSTAQSMFVDIQEAYEVLKDLEARDDYDRNYRHPSFDLFRDFVTTNITVIQIDEYLNKGASADACNAFNQTILMFAANRGRLDLVEFLTKNNASINSVDGAGNTALMYAAMPEDVIFSIDNAAIIKEKNAKYYEARESNEEDVVPPSFPQKREDKIANFLISIMLSRFISISTNWLMISMGLDASRRYQIMLTQKTVSSMLIFYSHLGALEQLADQVKMLVLGIEGKSNQEPKTEDILEDRIEVQSPNYLMLIASVTTANLIPTAASVILNYYGFDLSRIAYISRIGRLITMPIVIYKNSEAVYEVTIRGADYLYDILRIEQASSWLSGVFSSVKRVAFKLGEYFGFDTSKLELAFERVEETVSLMQQQAFKLGEYLGFNETGHNKPKIKEKILDEKRIKVNREKAKIVEFLISRNASILDVNYGNKTTLDFAIQYKNIPLMNSLYRHLGWEEKIVPEEELMSREKAEAEVEVYQTDSRTLVEENENSVQSYFSDRAIDPILLASKPNQVAVEHSGINLKLEKVEESSLVSDKSGLHIDSKDAAEDTLEPIMYLVGINLAYKYLTFCKNCDGEILVEQFDIVKLLLDCAERRTGVYTDDRIIYDGVSEVYEKFKVKYADKLERQSKENFFIEDPLVIVTIFAKEYFGLDLSNKNKIFLSEKTENLFACINEVKLQEVKVTGSTISAYITDIAEFF